MPSPTTATASADAPDDSTGAKLRRLTRFAEVLTYVGMAGATAVVLYVWSDPSRVRALAEQKIVCGEMPMTADARAWILSGVGALGALGVFIWLMWEVRGLFRTLGNGDFFAESIPRRLTRLGYLALGSALTNILMATLILLAFTMGNPPGQQMVAIKLSGADYVFVLVAIIFIMFAKVVREGRRLDEENRSII